MKEQNSWLIRLLYIIFFIWVVVSSMRAGGDLWDNPRYRFTLLPFLALILSWTIEHYQLTKSRWLWRWTAVISVFLIFFTNFYAYRYTGTLGVYIQFVPMVAMVAGLCVLIPVGGLIADRFGKKKPQE